MITAILGLLVGASFTALMFSHPKDPALPLILAVLGISAPLSVLHLVNDGYSVIAAMSVVFFSPVIALLVVVAVAICMDR